MNIRHDEIGRALARLVMMMALAFFGSGVTGLAADACADACGHAATHEEKQEDDHDAHDEDGQHDHDAHDHDMHDDHGDEAGILLSADQQKRFGIHVRVAASGTLASSLRLTGNVTFNEDRVAHLVPRAPGIATHVDCGVGDLVMAGARLATIESAELAEAKLDYVAAVTELGCCQYELPRAQAIHDNVTRLLEATSAPDATLDTIRAVDGEMGAYRGSIMEAYTDYLLAKQSYSREKQLHARKIASDTELLEAESAYRQAEAKYLALSDSVSYTVQQELLEAKQKQQVAEFERQTTRQRLALLGLSDARIELLSAMAGSADPQPTAPHACTDPNCKACNKAPTTPVKKSNTTLGTYDMRAPFAGVVTQRHISNGEFVGDETQIFTIADTTIVWVNLAVYAKDLSRVRAGMKVALKQTGGDAAAIATIERVTPFVDEASRFATARVVVENRDGSWIPGSFAVGQLLQEGATHAVVVPKGAVQTIDGESVVFVAHGDAFETQPVALGEQDATHVVITSGLAPGQRYVAEGAFHLKSTIITRALDPHAGHGH